VPSCVSVVGVVKACLHQQNIRRYEDELTKETIAIIVIPTYEGGLPNENSKNFFAFLKDAVEDFRVGTGYLPKLNFAVFSLGDSVYGDNFCAVRMIVVCCLLFVCLLFVVLSLV
jgi:sulfite reductase alpha subunit-like flavoprotein